MPDPASPIPPRFAGLFPPLLAGATARERVLAAIGAFLAILVTGLVCGALTGTGLGATLLATSMGSAAVLLFAVPTSPMAQPWPIIGGNSISAAMGVLAATLIGEPALAAAAAVALAILAMSATRSLHPPGGASALAAALGGGAVAQWGWLFPLVPVAFNACVLVALGIGFHALMRRPYPHRSAPANAHGTADTPAAHRTGFSEADIDAALAGLEESYDIDRGDLARLLRRVEHEAVARVHGTVTCDAIMSRDVVSVTLATPAADARDLLLRHALRILPVLDMPEGRLVGTIGLRELAVCGESIAGHVSQAHVATPQRPALGLLPVLTGGSAHAVVVITPEGQVAGILTQTDLMAAMATMVYDGQRTRGTTAR